MTRNAARPRTATTTTATTFDQSATFNSATVTAIPTPPPRSTLIRVIVVGDKVRFIDHLSDRPVVTVVLVIDAGHCCRCST
jgi:hypothetical protein